MYELTYIINPLAGELDTSAVSGKVRSFINGLGGNIKKESISEKKKLSYPIKKQLAGFYATLELEIEDTEKLSELEKMLTLDNDILRHLIINLTELKPVKAPKKAYLKPRPFTLSGEVPAKAALSVTKAEKVKIEELDKKLEEILKE